MTKQVVLPSGFHSITPRTTVNDAAAQVEFHERYSTPKVTCTPTALPKFALATDGIDLARRYPARRSPRFCTSMRECYSLAGRPVRGT
jgi:hypothetical protein